MGFILYYNLITPYFVRQHYKAVQLKMTISPQQHGFQKKQELWFHFVLKMFSLKKNWRRNKTKHNSRFKLPGCNKMGWWGGAKGTEERCGVHWRAPFYQQPNPVSHYEWHLYSFCANKVARNSTWLFKLTIPFLSHTSHISCDQQPHVASAYCTKHR